MSRPGAYVASNRASCRRLLQPSWRGGARTRPQSGHQGVGTGKLSEHQNTPCSRPCSRFDDLPPRLEQTHRWPLNRRYSALIFAFGQTGSGKTHTIFGPRLGQLQAAVGAAACNGGPDAPRTPPPLQVARGWGDGPVVADDDGLLARCAQALFRFASLFDARLLSGPVSHAWTLVPREDQLRPDPAKPARARCARSCAGQRASEADFSVTVSCLEVYNEAVADLLGADRQRPCQVCRCTGGDPVVQQRDMPLAAAGSFCGFANTNSDHQHN